MIFRIDKTFTGKLSSQERSEFYCDIIGHGHYADCDDNVRDGFYADIEANGSTLQRDMAKKDPSLKLTTRMRNFLTTIDVGQFTMDQLKLLTCRQAKLLVENEGYERPVYEDMIGVYAKSDRSYRSMFIKLNQALNDGMLTFQNGGGHGNYVSLLESFNEHDYRDVVDWKFCSLVDRDTENNLAFDANKNSFFRHMCGRDNTSLCDADIYSLSQSPRIWHMWYRRAIENYFPNKQFRYAKVDLKTMPSVPADRNYKDLGSMNGYAKHKLPKLTTNMAYADYEHGLVHFQTTMGNVSELQLFLLKILRII